MRRVVLTRVWRGAIAAAGAVALVATPIRSAGDAAFSLANYLSYFTILSNIAVVLVLALAASGASPTRSGRPVLPLLRGAVTTYIIVTGLMYYLIFDSDALGIAGGWPNLVLHRVIPIAVALDWLFDSALPAASARRTIAQWLLPPAAYLVYTLLRGPLAHWYPYAFLDPSDGGIVELAGHLAALTVACGVIATAVYLVPQLRARGPQADRRSIRVS